MPKLVWARVYAPEQVRASGCWRITEKLKDPGAHPKHPLRKKGIRDILTHIIFGISAEKGNIMAVQKTDQRTVESLIV